MALPAKTRLGPYEIVNAIGTGGMGEVYRARDTKLAREVALKVLPEALAADPERVARFEREAEVLASLSHPNIASIHGFEDSGGVRALVMELVEGPTLAELIAMGPLRLEDALPIAKQICDALEYAHDRGIVHGDLKPANVKITLEHTVKILDFGLAKALEGETAAGRVSTSPTTGHPATPADVTPGAAAYLSSEQAKGQPADRRADIWAFGCVLFEMLTAKKAFDGETIGDILAAMVKGDPDWAALPPSSPRRILELLRRCLTQDPRQRLQAIGEARIAIERAFGGQEKEDATPKPERPRRQRTAWVLVVILALVAAGLGAREWLASRASAAPAIVSQIPPPPEANFVFGGNEAGPPAISPDGKQLAFVAVGQDGKQKLWIRPLNAATARPLAGTDGASYPFWSPDGRSIGFFAHGKLNRLDASGGPTVAIAVASDGRGGAWSRDGTILFAPGPGSPIYRMPAEGGTAQPVTELNVSRQETAHRWPQFLPDGKHFLFHSESKVAHENATYADALENGVPTLLVRGDSNAVYAPPGYLLFDRHGNLMAQQFDAGSLRLIGQATPLVEQAAVNSNIWRGVFAVSKNGILAYQPGNAARPNARLLWFDRSGKQIGETGTLGNHHAESLSPDGHKLAVDMAAPGTSSVNIWVYDLTRGSRTRLTSGAAIDAAPSWSPDGATIAFMSNRTGQFHLYERAANGTGSASPLLVDDAEETFPAYSSNGRFLIFQRRAERPGSYLEIWSLPLFGNRKPFPVVQNLQSDAFDPVLSPDGKWLAYVSLESGRDEVHIVPFGHGSGKWVVSNGGGMFPLWRRDGRELFYLSLDNKIMSAQVLERGASLAIGKVVPLFQANPISMNAWPFDWPYDVTADGQEFIVSTSGGQKTPEPLTLVSNWPELLKKQ